MVILTRFVLLVILAFSAVSAENNGNEYIRSVCESLMENRPVEVEGIRIFSTNVLPVFYLNRDFSAAWNDEKNVRDALDALKNSANDGLDPEDYHYSYLRDFYENIVDKSALEKAEFDILMTDAGILYAHHLIVGKVDPENLDAQWNYHSRKLDKNPAKMIELALKNREIPQFIKKLRPRNKYYLSLMDAYEAYRKMAEKGGWKEIPEGEVIVFGDRSERVVMMRERLWISGDLAYTGNLDSPLADSAFIAAVKRFQRRHGLAADGKIGKGTIREMNIPVEQRIDQIRVNLERARWVLANLSEKYVIVNIASFKLWYMEADTIRFTTNVVVGKQFHETPVFRDSIRYIVFNPTWTIPRSILKDEMFAKIKRNYHYLTKRNLSLVTYGGKVVDPASINWDDMTFSKFKYMVRQEPGPMNALGRVKFMFPNKYSIYLHDTPSKSLFNRTERGFSHGCVRVQYPLDLAALLLDDNKKWSREAIDKVVQTEKTTSVRLKKPIPVLILYWTAISRNGIVYFSKDIYERDKKVLKALRSSAINDSRKAYSEKEEL